MGGLSLSSGIHDLLDQGLTVKKSRGVTITHTNVHIC